jgi:hypothetical protein
VLDATACYDTPGYLVGLKPDNITNEAYCNTDLQPQTPRRFSVTLTVKFKNMITKKPIGLLHLWLGLASGLVVFILGLTGCIYAFEDEIREHVYHERLYITPEHKARLPVSTLLGRAQKQLKNRYLLKMTEVTNPADRTYRWSRKVQVPYQSVQSAYRSVTTKQKI